MNRKYWEKLFRRYCSFVESAFRGTDGPAYDIAIGGYADLYIEPETEAELAGVLGWRRRRICR